MDTLRLSAIVRHTQIPKYAPSQYFSWDTDKTEMRQLSTKEEKLEALQHIIEELISQRDTKQILHLITEKAMKLTNCNAGSIYIAKNPEELIFAVAINNSVQFDFKESVVSAKERGFAAYSFRTGEVVCIDDVYDLAEDSPYTFNCSFDKSTGYKTKSVLVHPLVSSKGERLGVLQLINPLKGEGMGATIDTFHEEELDFLSSFATVAASCIENARLYENIRDLFEGFIRSSVKIIESRDPATAGHSERVAVLSVDLATQVDKDSFQLKSVEFSKTQIEELRYAALLHDFGKVGVKEQVLLKGKKLLETQKREIHDRLKRFQHLKEIELLWAFLAQIKDSKKPVSEKQLKTLMQSIDRHKQEIGHTWDTIAKLNEPTVLDEEKQSELNQVAAAKFVDVSGSSKNFLDEHEVHALSIKRGSLTLDERHEIESHVTKTYQFLVEIPWGKAFETLPEIAYAHHEKLNGSGYPRGLKADQIPMQSRIMTICDIYDALVAEDRPYKSSLPVEKALSILESMVKDGQLDGQLFDVFREAKVFENRSFSTLLPPKRAKKRAA